VSYALLTVLEQLTPAERTAFVLHDVFDVSFPEVAEIVGRSPDSVRQLASRARRHVAAARPARPVSGAEHRRVVEAFARASQEGDVAHLLELLDPDVTFTADGGGHAIAARKPLRGALRVARAWGAICRRDRAARRTVVDVNGAAGLLIEGATMLIEGATSGRTLLAFTVDGARIVRVDVLRNPAKLRGL
jgi:RNA polymerase sigma-70 factor (ECF subfamily)